MMPLFFKSPPDEKLRGQPMKLTADTRRIVMAIVLWILLGALAAISETKLAAASESLWTCFELLFAGILGVLGFEGASDDLGRLIKIRNR
jgi:hypothetical protein